MLGSVYFEVTLYNLYNLFISFFIILFCLCDFLGNSFVYVIGKINGEEAIQKGGRESCRC